MISLKLVGAGALGSVLAEEISKTAYSLNIGLKLDIYDFDDVEERNCAAQNFTPADLKKFKAEVVGLKCQTYAPAIDVNYHIIKLTEENITEQLQLDDQSIIIDVVDNIPTRQLLWLTGMTNNVPVIHAGMAQTGVGFVTWNYKEYDSFPYSPANIDPKYLTRTVEKEEHKLPPCELNGFRQMITNTAMATRDSLFLFFGIDITGEFKQVFEGEGRILGLMTRWVTSTRNCELDAQQSGSEEWVLRNG